MAPVIDLSGKIVLVTGASRGIGAAAADLFVRVGANVAVNYFRSGDKAEALISTINARQQKAIAVQCDVSVRCQVEKMVDTVLSALAVRIINISSTAGQRGEAFHSHYAATKGAVISFTKSLAAELAPDNILVNAVAPGWVDTDMSAEPLHREAEKIYSTIPLRRVATAEEIAGAILFLASDLATYTTGEIVNVNGGSVLCG